jgi:hypothetical protein
MPTDETKQDSASEDDRIRALRESIRRSFPAEPYKGKITDHDGEFPDHFDEETAILDDEKELYDAFRGKAWTEVPIEIFQHQPSGYDLLADEAYAVFIAAWLMRSLENMDAENEVRDFVVYSFQTMRKFRVLNPEQQLTVRSLLVEFAQRGTSKFAANLAKEAVALIDRHRY